MIRPLRDDRLRLRLARPEGAYLCDWDGERYLDWLGGFGMFNVGRNNPRVRDGLVDSMELQTRDAPHLPAPETTPLPKRAERAGRGSSP